MYIADEFALENRLSLDSMIPQWLLFLHCANYSHGRCVSHSIGKSHEFPFQFQVIYTPVFSAILLAICGSRALAHVRGWADGQRRSNESGSVGATESATFADFRPWRGEHAGNQCRRHHSLPDAGRSGRFVYRFGRLVGMGKAYAGATKSADAGSFQP